MAARPTSAISILVAIAPLVRHAVAAAVVPLQRVLGLGDGQERPRRLPLSSETTVPTWLRRGCRRLNRLFWSARVLAAL